MESTQYSYQLQPNDLTDYLFYNYWRDPKNRVRRVLMQYVLPLVAFGSGGYLLVWGTSTAGNVYGGFVLLAGLMLLFFPKLYRQRIAKQTNQIAEHEKGRLLFVPTTAKVEPDALSFHIEGYEPLRIPRSEIQEVKETPDYVAVLYGQAGQFQLIPKAAFRSESEKQTFIETLSQPSDADTSL